MVFEFLIFMLELVFLLSSLIKKKIQKNSKNLLQCIVLCMVSPLTKLEFKLSLSFLIRSDGWATGLVPCNQPHVDLIQAPVGVTDEAKTEMQ